MSLAVTPARDTRAPAGVPPARRAAVGAAVGATPPRAAVAARDTFDVDVDVRATDVPRTGARDDVARETVLPPHADDDTAAVPVVARGITFDVVRAVTD